MKIESAMVCRKSGTQGTPLLSEEGKCREETEGLFSDAGGDD
jgi:hypothetical protein